MQKFTSGTSNAVNTRKAVKECLELAQIDSSAPPTLIIVHASVGHKLNEMLDEFTSLLPKTKIAGCTGSGVIGKGMVSEAMRAMAIMAVYSDETYVVSSNEINGQNTASIAENCAQAIYAQNPDINMIMVNAPGLDVDGEAIISGVEKVFGSQVPIFGALGGFRGMKPVTPVFDGHKNIEHGLALVGIADTGLELVQASHHGSTAQPDCFTVTKSEGLRIDELDGQPAWPILMSSLGLPRTTQPFEVINLLAMGLDLEEEDQREYDNEKILRAPLNLDDNGESFYFQTEIPVGTVLTSCQRNEKHLLDGSKRLMERIIQKLKGRKPLAVFQSDCMGRGRLVQNVVEKEVFINEMQEALSGDKSIPWLGVYGFAEFGMLNGRNRFHNYTTTLSVVVLKE